MGYIQIVSCITGPSGYGSIPEEKGREIWQHLSDAWPVRKRCRRREGMGAGGLGGCQGHLRELSREADLWRTLLAKAIPEHICVCACVGACSQSRQYMQHMHPWRFKYSRSAQVQRSELELIHTENQIFSKAYSEREMKHRIKITEEG